MWDKINNIELLGGFQNFIEKTKESTNSIKVRGTETDKIWCNTKVRGAEEEGLVWLFCIKSTMYRKVLPKNLRKQVNRPKSQLKVKEYKERTVEKVP